MGWPKLLVLVRHAESEGNIRTANERAGFPVPTHEYSLTERGRTQAAITGKYLHECYGEFDTYYTSYYKRAKETMEIMYPNARIYEDPRLAEAQRGIWHTMTSEEAAKILPFEQMRKEREGLYHYRPLGGENWADIELRIHSFMSTLNRDYDGQRVLMVVHGHWLVLFQRLVHHFSIDEAVQRYEQHLFKNASVTVYESFLTERGSRLKLVQENLVPWEGEMNL